MGKHETRWLVGETAFSGTRDEAIVKYEMWRALDQLRHAPADDQRRLRARIEGLSLDLARALERSGREHLASALWP